MITTSSPSILIVHADEQGAQAIVCMLADAGYHATWMGNSIDGLIAVEDASPALVLIDWAMPDLDGATFARAVRLGLKQPPPLIALAKSEAEPATLKEAPIVGWLPLPVEPSRLMHLVADLIGAPPRTIAG